MIVALFIPGTFCWFFETTIWLSISDGSDGQFGGGVRACKGNGQFIPPNCLSTKRGDFLRLEAAQLEVDF